MPDLSNLLGAVYGDGPSTPSRDPEDEAHVEREPAAQDRGPAVPDWADDDHLDAAFAEWKPGPSEDATPAEHAFVQDADDDPAPPLPDDLAAALSEALVAASGTADDTADPASDKPRFDFSIAGDDEDEPQNLSKSENEPDEHAQTPQVHELGEVVGADLAPEPVTEHTAFAPEPEAAWEPQPEQAAWKPEPEPEAQWEPEHADEPAAEEPIADYGAPEAVHDVEPPQEADEPEVDTWPTSTNRRAAAAELTAANRPEPAAITPATTPLPEPEPFAAPVAPRPEPVLARTSFAGDGAEAPTTLPAGMRRWDRSEDDILPEKSGKKFFSFSLRRG